MNRHYPIDKSKRPLIPSKEVTFCPDCGSPVVVAPNAMEEHRQRVNFHRMPEAAAPLYLAAPRWDREW